MNTLDTFKLAENPEPEIEDIEDIGSKSRDMDFTFRSGKHDIFTYIENIKEE